MSIVGGFDIHRKQITFDHVDTVTGEVRCGQVAPADRRHLAEWLQRFAGRDDVAFAAETCTGWRYVVEELQRAGVSAHLAEPADTAAARGRKKRAKTDRADARLIRELLEDDRVPECWIPPSDVLEHRALLELYHDLRREHTGWIQRIHAVLYHQGAERLPGTAPMRAGNIWPRSPRGSCRPPGRSRSPPPWTCSRRWRGSWTGSVASSCTWPGTCAAPRSSPSGSTGSGRSPRWR